MRRRILSTAACLALGLGASGASADTGAALAAGSEQSFEGGGLGFTLTGGFNAGATTDYWAVIPNDATAIEQGFKNFSIPLTSATNVQVRIDVKGETTGEYIAIDNYRICGDVAVTISPTLAAIEGAALDYNEGDPATQVTNTITVGDSDSAQLASGTVQITSNSTPSEDALNATGTGSIVVGGNGTTSLTLSGAGTLAQYQQVLRSVTYANSNVLNPNTAQRTVQFQVADGDANASNLMMRNINVINTVQTFPIPHTESFDDGLGTGDRYEVVGGFDVGPDDFFARLSAAENATRFGTAFSGVVGGGFFGGEDIDQNGLPNGGEVVVCLNASGIGNITVDVLLGADATGNAFELGDGVWVEYKFDAGPWEKLLAFRPTVGGASLSEDTDNDNVGDGDALSETLTNFSRPILASGGLLKVRVRASNGTTNEEIAFDELVVNGIVVGSSPVLADINTGPLSYSEGDGPVVVSGTATITDADDTDMEEATVTISGNYNSAEDVLGFTPSGGITGSFATGTGTLSLTGPASKAAFETVLKSVTYENTNLVAPDQSTRTVAFLVNDGESNSNAQSTLISILDLVVAQSMPFCESFETDGLGTRYAANSFNLGNDDHFARLAIPHESISATNADGGFAFLGEDTDADGSAVHALEIGVDTSGYTGLGLELKLAAAANQFELTDTILIEASADGGPFVRLSSFHPDGTNSSLSEDGDNNGTGDGAVVLGPISRITTTLWRVPSSA
jgi:hypothetical protein